MIYRKQIIFHLLLVLFSCHAYGQDFFPSNFIHLITDETGQKDKFTILNEAYIREKGFNKINDSLYIHPASNEKLVLNTNNTGNESSIKITYYLNTGLDKFRSSLQNLDLQLKRLNENLYQSLSDQYKLQFLLKPDLMIAGKKMNAIVFSLKFKNGTRFNSSSEYNFPITDLYPFQHTTWFFTVNYEKAKKYSDETDLIINLTKIKSPNKVEFLNDLEFKIIYLDKSNTQQILTGSYNNGQTISFSAQYPTKSKNIKYKNVKTIRVHEVPPTSIPVFDAYDLDKLKNSFAYFQFFFNQSYQVEKYPNRILLTGKLYNGNPTTSPMPTNSH